VVYELKRVPEGFEISKGGKRITVKSKHEEAFVLMSRLSQEDNCGWWDAVDRCGLRLAHEPKVVRDSILKREAPKPFDLAAAFASLSNAV
jgi:hypothetical protein